MAARRTRPLASAYSESSEPGTRPEVSSLVPNGPVSLAAHLCTMDPRLTGPYCEMPNYGDLCCRLVTIPRDAGSQISTGTNVDQAAAAVHGTAERGEKVAGRVAVEAEQATGDVEKLSDEAAKAAGAVGGLVKSVQDGVEKIKDAWKGAKKPEKPAPAPAAAAKKTSSTSRPRVATDADGRRRNETYGNYLARTMREQKKDQA